MDKLPGGPIDPREVVYRTLGGPGEKYEINIDEISAHSEWRPNFSIAEQYHTASLKVFLAGDAGEFAHQNPKTKPPANQYPKPTECHPTAATA